LVKLPRAPEEMLARFVNFCQDSPIVKLMQVLRQIDGIIEDNEKLMACRQQAGLKETSQVGEKADKEKATPSKKVLDAALGERVAQQQLAPGVY